MSYSFIRVIRCTKFVYPRNSLYSAQDREIEINK